jgi:hypothetical protein
MFDKTGYSSAVAGFMPAKLFHFLVSIIEEPLGKLKENKI